MDWYRLFNPLFWIQNEPTSEEWDRVLNELLDKYGVTSVNQYTARVGNLEIWVCNYPYSFGHTHNSVFRPEQPSLYNNVLPKVKTRIRLKKMIEQVQKEQFNKFISK